MAATIELAFLPAPSKDYLSKTELAAWLGLKVKQVNQHIQTGKIPDGKIRLGLKLKTWNKLEAAIAKWQLENADRYAGYVPPTEEEDEEE